MKLMIHRMILIMAAALLVAAVVVRFGNTSSILGQAALAANDPAKSPEAKKPVYLPPMRGAPTRRTSAATRGIGDDNIFMTVLAPESTGLTSSASPTLYWFVSRAPTRQVEFALIRDDRIEPVAELTLGVPVTVGIIKVSLAELGTHGKLRRSVYSQERTFQGYTPNPGRGVSG